MSTFYTVEYADAFNSVPPVEDNAAQLFGQSVNNIVTKASITGLAATDMVVLWKAKKGTFWDAASWIKVAALGSNGAIKVGDSGDDDRFLTSTTATSDVCATMNAPAGAGYQFTADTDIILTVAGDNPTDALALVACIKTSGNKA